MGFSWFYLANRVLGLTFECTFDIRPSAHLVRGNRGVSGPMDACRANHDQDEQDDHQDRYQRGWDRMYPAIDAPQKTRDDHHDREGNHEHQDRLAEY